LKLRSGLGGSRNDGSGSYGRKLFAMKPPPES
jgi:hypothetical protein